MVHAQGEDPMSSIPRNLVTCFAAACCLLWLGFASAQPAGCTLQHVGQQDVLHCADDLVITKEAGASLALEDRNDDGKPDAAKLDSKAVLVDLPRRDGATGFEVITPQAIAAVRGTRWAVDVKPGMTSVFVIRGQVDVSRPAGDESVVLGPGEGVDVKADGSGLTVKRWPAKRVAALLARLGR
jgi:ferric-dicitrate binding protein FerR (iron transport regulator)